MNPDEEYIKLSEMVIQRQWNQSVQKDLKSENIRNHVSSAISQKDEVRQGIYVSEEKTVYQTVYEKLQDGQKLTGEEEETLRQDDPEAYRKAKDIEGENEYYQKILLNCRTKEEVQRTEKEYRRFKRLGLSATENIAALPIERRLEYTLFKDAKISAISAITRQFMESDKYREMPTDAEYIQEFGEEPPESAYMEMAGETEVQRIKGKSEYERIFRTTDAESDSRSGKSYSFDGKG